MVVEKLEKYPALNSDPNYDHCNVVDKIINSTISRD